MHKLTEWCIEKIKREYPDDIALLIAVPGQETDGDAHGTCFDFFVPATERGNELAETFIIDGVGHDLYPRSWERLENSAELNDMVGVLERAEILYARTETDATHFEEIRQKLYKNLADPEFIYEKALGFLDEALDVYRSFQFEEKTYRARSEAEDILMYLSSAVATLNHSYTDSALFDERQAYESDPAQRIYHCPELLAIPDGFFENARKLLTPQPVPELRETVHALIRTTREFVLEHEPAGRKPEAEADYQGLADWYQELSLTWRRLRYFCENGMVEKAYSDACYLQREFLILAEEWGIDELNLLDSFDPKDLSLLALRANQLEKVIRGLITGHDVRVNEYPDLETFLEERKEH